MERLSLRIRSKIKKKLHFTLWDLAIGEISFTFGSYYCKCLFGCVNRSHGQQDQRRIEIWWINCWKHNTYIFYLYCTFFGILFLWNVYLPPMCRIPTISKFQSSLHSLSENKTLFTKGKKDHKINHTKRDHLKLLFSLFHFKFLLPFYSSFVTFHNDMSAFRWHINKNVWAIKLFPLNILLCSNEPKLGTK